MAKAARQRLRATDDRHRVRHPTHHPGVDRQPLLNTIGQLCDLLAAALLLHVFLAYPSGRLGSQIERVVVVTAYVAALGLQLVILMLGGFNDRHLLTVVKRPAAAEAVQDLLLLMLSALALVGVVLLWRRWRSLPSWQRRRSTQIVINCFSLSLVMLAALLIVGAFQLPGFEILRLATFAVVGLAPLAFLAGLLDARLAKARRWGVAGTAAREPCARPPGATGPGAARPDLVLDLLAAPVRELGRSERQSDDASRARQRTPGYRR